MMNCVKDSGSKVIRLILWDFGAADAYIGV